MTCWYYHGSLVLTYQHLTHTTISATSTVIVFPCIRIIASCCLCLKTGWNMSNWNNYPKISLRFSLTDGLNGLGDLFCFLFATSISALFTGRLQPCVKRSLYHTLLMKLHFVKPCLFAPKQLMKMHLIHISFVQLSGNMATDLKDHCSMLLACMGKKPTGLLIL